MAIDASIDHQMPIGRETIKSRPTSITRSISSGKPALKAKSVMRGEHVGVVIISDPDGNQVVFVQGNGERHRAVAGKFS